MALMSGGGPPDSNTNKPTTILAFFVRPSGPASTQRRSASGQHIALKTIMASKRVQHQSHCLTRGRFCDCEAGAQRCQRTTGLSRVAASFVQL